MNINSIRFSLSIILILCLSSALFAQKTVHVREYKRKDGTVVRAHDRRAPGSRSSTSASETGSNDEAYPVDPVPQEIAKVTNWQPIKEMSGEIPNYPGLTVDVFASEIARGGDVIKLLMRFEYPWGSPGEIFRAHVPQGFDPTSIRTVLVRFEFNCTMKTVATPTASADLWQFNGKHHKSSESSFNLNAGHVLFEYFCERGDAPTKAPTLKPKP